MVKWPIVLLFLFFFLDVTLAQTMSEKTQSALSQIKGKNIIGIEVLVAGASFQSPASAFGHSMIRLVAEGDNPFQDFVLSFIAEGSAVDEAYLTRLSGSKINQYYQSAAGLTKFLAKGAFGSYSMGLSISSLQDTLEHYAGVEGRTLKRLIVPMTPEQRNRFLQILYKFGEGKIKTPYYFSAANCVTFIEKLLQQSGLPYFPLTTNIPIEIENAMNRFLWTPYPAVEMLNVPSIVRQVADSLPAGTQLNGIMSKDIFLEGIKSLGKLDLLRLYLLDSFRYPQDVRDLLAERIASLPGNPTLEEIYGTRTFEPQVYQLGKLNQLETLKRHFISNKTEHCLKMHSAILYRGAFPLTEEAASTFKDFRELYQKYCQ